MGGFADFGVEHAQLLTLMFFPLNLVFQAKNRIQMPKKNVTPQKPVNDLDFVDDNDALLQVEALIT